MHITPEGAASLLTAFSGLLLGVIGYWQSKAGSRETATQQVAARRLEEREQQFVEMKEARDSYKELANVYHDRFLNLEEETRVQVERLKNRLDVKDQHVREAMEMATSTRTECAVHRQMMATVIRDLADALRDSDWHEIAQSAIETSAAHAESTDPAH